MTAAKNSRILPMRTEGTHHFVDRAYRETGAFQWVRETFANAVEAGATRVEYSIDWQAAESLGVYRRLIADNGKGMTAEELVGFFNTFGGSGKPIGGLHENFGIGAKTSLLPWNRYGLVVISWHDGDASMIWVTQDRETQEYGLKLEKAIDPETGEESLDEVYAPFDDPEHGCNWASVKPDWIDKNGTVIVLLGNEPTQSTVTGDPDRSESDIKGVATYLNRRIWKMPSSISVRALEFHSGDQTRWPRNEAEASSSRSESHGRTSVQWRNIEGAEHYIEYPVDGFSRGKLGCKGTVRLSDDTCIDWYLWSGDRPKVGSYAAESGYIAALYKNELYNIQTHHATFRSFGISEQEVRSRLWLVVRPPLFDETAKLGVYPRQDRNALLLRGGPNAGKELPLTDWGAEFSENMPSEILDAIRAARSTRDGTIEDNTWRDRLADRFGTRWRISKLRAKVGGLFRTSTTDAGSTPNTVVSVKRKKGPSDGGESGGTRGAHNLGTRGGHTPAERVRVSGGIPRFRLVSAGQLGEGMIAAWQPNDPEFPEGAVLINVEHPILQLQVEYWQNQYPEHFADEVGRAVLDVYGEIAVAKVAHSAFLSGLIPSKVIEEKLRSEEALTMALLGLIGEEAVIAPRLGGKFKKQKGQERLER